MEKQRRDEYWDLRAYVTVTMNQPACVNGMEVQKTESQDQRIVK